MKKQIKRLSVIGLIMLFFSLWPVNGLAEDGQLLYDLRYDESKSVLYGKTRPNANVYINDVAGNIVADDNGEFEMPVPKGLKISTVLMLDAEGDTSTDLRFNFEKNTIETESSSAKGESSTPASSSETKKEESSKEEKEKESETKESIKELESTETTDSSKESSSSTKQSISSESYDPSEFKEEKRSLVWLWTLLIVVGVLGLAVATYLCYKKKLEKEEAEKEAKRRKRQSKNKGKRKKSLDDDFEDDLYASLKLDEEPRNETANKTRSSKHSENSLDALIDSEIEKSKVETERVKTSRTRNGKKRKKKKSTKN